jgi:hypothetical protein
MAFDLFPIAASRLSVIGVGGNCEPAGTRSEGIFRQRIDFARPMNRDQKPVGASSLDVPASTLEYAGVFRMPAGVRRHEGTLCHDPEAFGAKSLEDAVGKYRADATSGELLRYFRVNKGQPVAIALVVGRCHRITERKLEPALRWIIDHRRGVRFATILVPIFRLVTGRCACVIRMAQGNRIARRKRVLERFVQTTLRLRT